MKCLHALSFVPVVLIALASPAMGQDAPPPGEPPSSYLAGVGGAAFNQDFNDHTAMMGVEYGERVHRDVIAYANYTYINNLMSEKQRQYLEFASSTTPQEYTGRDRGMGFSMGAMYLMPLRSTFRPYFGGGFGLMNLKRHITEQTLGDVSESFYETTGLNDGVINVGDTDVTKPLGDLMAGISGALKNRAYIDVKYRYGHVFQVVENVDFSQVSVTIGVTF